MTQEDYISFETAKLLKEKGFDEKCRTYYKVFPESRIAAIYHSSENRGVSEDDPNEILCPTLQMVMKWLRKVHEIFIRPNISFLYPIRYYCEILCYGDNLKTQQDVTTETFESPEEACEASIKYCLENLI